MVVGVATGIEEVAAGRATGLAVGVTHLMPAGAADKGVRGVDGHPAEVMVSQLRVAQVAGEVVAAGRAAVANDIDQRAVVDTATLRVHPHSANDAHHVRGVQALAALACCSWKRSCASEGDCTGMKEASR